jgi:hypothetical protein
MSTKIWTQTLQAVLPSRPVPEPLLGELLLRSESSSGFVRERATLQLGEFGDPLALPSLIVRANDWVPEVRVAAMASLSNLAVPSNARAFVICLPLFYWLRHCRRAEHAPLIARIETFVCQPDNAVHVLEGIESSVTGVARACLLLALEHRLGALMALVRVGLNHPDTVVRMRVAPLIADLHGNDRHVVLAAALQSRTVAIRRAALRLLLSEHAAIDYVQYLFDRHTAVRQLVAAQLARAGFNVGSAYRNTLTSEASPRRRAIALWGLGEHGRADDAGLITRYLSDASATLRRHALTALARRSDGGIRTAVLDALADADAAVVRHAVRIASRERLQFDAHELQAILYRADGERVLASLLNAHRVSNKWERVIFLLAMRKHGPSGLERFGEAVWHWNAHYNRSFVQLSAAQIAALRDVLRDQPPHLGGAKGGHAYEGLLITLKEQGIAAGE